MKISFWEQTANLENNRIVEYRKTISQMKQEIEDLKNMKAEEYFAKKEKEEKEEEEEEPYNEEEKKKIKKKKKRPNPNPNLNPKKKSKIQNLKN